MGLYIPADEDGAKRLQAVGQANAALGVNRVHSHVSRDKSMSSCVYDAPSAEAIWLAAEESGLPADTITEVSVLDPYFYY
jgi:Nickel responsive protein SCO4226-like